MAWKIDSAPRNVEKTAFANKAKREPKRLFTLNIYSGSVTEIELLKAVLNLVKAASKGR